MFALGRTIAGGIKVGLTTVFFNSMGIIVWMTVVAFGLGGLVQSQPLAINAIRIIGAAYLFYIGAKTVVTYRRDRDAALRSGQGVALAEQSEHFNLAKIAREGFTVGLTNPKLAVFFCAVLPQFVDSVSLATAQMLTLGMIFFVIGVVGDSIYVLTAGLIRSWLLAKADRALKLQLIGGLLISGLALVLIFEGVRDLFV